MSGKAPLTLQSINNRQRAMFWVGVVFAVFLTLGMIGIAVALGVLNSQNVKYITGVGPDGGGQITLLAGLGELIVTDAPNNDITISNTGVVTVNSLNADAGGNLLVDVTAPGLGITNVGNTITLSNGGVTSVTAGAGIAVTPAGTGDVTVANTGVITVNNLPADVAGNVILATNPGLSQTSVGNTVTFSNDGVLTINSLAPVAGDVIVTATDGLSVANAGNTVQFADILTTETHLDNDDALGPLVDYTVFIGFLTPVPEGTWRTGLNPGFPNPFVPGSFDDGQGNVGGVIWAVPALGTYTVNVDCEVQPSALDADDYQSASAALCLGATSEDPLAAGRIPMGAYTSIDLSVGVNGTTLPPLYPRLSMSTTFQAGCTGCMVSVGQPLTVHARTDHTGGGPPVSANFVCRMQVARIK